MPNAEDISKADVLIHASEWATVWMFEPKSGAAREIFESEIGFEDWQSLGGKYAVDHRPARALAQHLSNQGLSLLHPEFGWFNPRRAA